MQWVTVNEHSTSDSLFFFGHLKEKIFLAVPIKGGVPSQARIRSLASHYTICDAFKFVPLK